MDVVIRYETVGLWAENSYIIEYKGKSILIDPGDDFSKLDDSFSKNGCTPVCIINTHAHFDHIGSVEDFKIKYNLPFYLHSKDKRLLHQANLYRRITGDTQISKSPGIDFYLDDMEYISFEDKKIFIHHLPGHSDGSVCFEIDKNLISGDIIFQDILGRIDLPGGNKPLLNASVSYILDRFKGYAIYPGHTMPFILDEHVIAGIKKLI